MRRRILIRYGLLPALFLGMLIPGISILGLSILGISTSVAQTTYYVASSGSDANDGRSVATPFRSLSRVDSVVLRPGDAVLFRRGDTFRGTLRVRQSGDAGKPIRFDAYGSGTKPVLAGSVPVTNWTKAGANQWQAACPTCGTSVTGVYRGGVAQPLGRYPNADAPNRGSLTILASLGTGQLTSYETLTTDWTGAEVVTRPTYWIINRAVVTRQTGNTLTIGNPNGYTLTDGWGFFVQNHPATLDQTGEWYYNPATRMLRLYDNQSDPNNQTITATATDQVIDLANVSFVTIQNLRVVQARKRNVYGLNARNLVLDSNDITDSGEDGVVVEGAGTDILIDNSTVANINNNGVYIGNYRNVTLRRSTIRRVGLLPGRGKSGDGQFNGLQSFATQNTLIENNVIDSIGYNGVSVQNNTTIRQNQITNFCMTKSDGGGIYLWNGLQLPMKNIRIESNIIRDGVGTPGSLADNTVSGAHGIFLDDCVEGIDVIDNTIANCQGLGIYMHAVSRVNLTGNTCFNNSVGQIILYNYEAPCLPRNNVLRRNVLMAKTATQGVVGYISGADDLPQFGVMEQNYYARPFNDISTVRAVYNRTVVGDLSLSQWQSRFGHDRASRPSPLTYNEHVLKSVSSANRVGSSFDTPSNGWESWSPYGNGSVAWATGNQPAQGSLTISFPSSSGKPDSYALAYKSIKAVVTAKSYLVRFDATAPVYKKGVVFIRQRQAPYRDLTRRYEFAAGPTPKSYEFALTVSADEADALLTFQVNEDNQPIRFNTVQLQEAATEPVNPNDVIRLAYNPATNDSTVVLSEPGRDVKNRYYARRLVLKPFTSVILLRDSLPPSDVSLLLLAGRSSLRVGEVTSLSLTVRSASAGRNTLPNTVVWRGLLPKNLTVLDPAGLPLTDSLLTGTVQRLLTDTTFVFRVKATASGQYVIAAQVTTTTGADPDSTPDSGTDDGEDDQASVILAVRELVPGETLAPEIVTATEPVAPVAESAVYPNPSPNEFVFTAGEDVSTLTVVDLLGRERYSTGTIRRGQTVRFGLALPDAHYLLRIHYKTSEHRVVKLIKQGR